MANKKLRYSDQHKAEWWSNPLLPYDDFIKEKYKCCRYYIISFLVEQKELNTSLDETFLYPKIFEILTEKNFIRSAELKITAEQLYETYKLFAKLVSEINEYIVFIPSVQTFCAFCNISFRELSKLQSLNDDIMDDVLNAINDYFVTSLSYAGQQGKASASLVSSLLKTDGNALISEKTKSEKNSTTKKQNLDDINDKLKDILGE